MTSRPVEQLNGNASRSAVLRIKGLQTLLGSKDKPVRAVDKIDLAIHPGETFALLGESGCGKSMTALSILRLLPPSGRMPSGEIYLGETELLSLPEAEMRKERGGRVAMIFQEPMTSLNPVIKVGDQIAEAVKLHDPDARSNIEARVVELLTAVGIPDPAQRAHEYPHQLSGGMKQRIMIAMALAGKPDLLIADEPTTALDVTIQAQVLSLLKDLQQQTGMAILLITHDLGVVAEVADRLAVMYAGQIVETAKVTDFFKSQKHPYSHKLLRALPNAEKRHEGLDVIPGMVPSLDSQFTGCRFVDRCEQAGDKCRTELPPWSGDVESGYLCHFMAEQESVETQTAEAPEEGALSSGRSLLNINNLKVHFPIHKGVFKRTVGHVKAVDGVDLSLAKGRTLALVGESGCGKTTVGKALLQLIRPTEGDVDFDGVELTVLRGKQLRRKRREFQIVFQDPASSMNPRMLVGDIVAEGMVAQGIGANRKERRQRVEQLLAQVGLPAEAVGRYPHEFSGGQRQRICIARALAPDPRLIVCDEPTSALDVSVQAQVLNLLKKLQDELHLAYLFITHDISVVAYLAHEVAVMYLGRIVERGPVEMILNKPAHPYTQALLSAVPVPDPEHDRTVLRLSGDLPSPVNPPVGCHFHPRCPQATDRCREAYPGVTDLSADHSVACWLHTS